MAAFPSVHRKTLRVFTVVIAGLAFLLMQSDLGSMTARPAAGFPKLMLWAWERPEDLTFVEPQTVGVAFLAGTLYLRGDDVTLRPRLQPLRVPAGTVLVAVVRVENDPAMQPTLSSKQRVKAVEEITRLTAPLDPQGVQIDFDAIVSQRSFYRELLTSLRRAIPSTTQVSMTALASWCIGDPWIADLPVDEAVPMLFGMGVDDRTVRAHLRGNRDFAAAVCRESVGVSTDEAPPAIPPGRRTYVFHRGQWTPEAVIQALAIARKPDENPQCTRSPDACRLSALATASGGKLRS